MTINPTQCPPACNGLPHGVGVGLKRQYVTPLLADPTAVDFVEIHAENYLSGGRQVEVLQEIARRWPLSVHGIALSLGGEDPLDKQHLMRLTVLLETVKPASFSEHIAWSRHEGVYFGDLLPIPYNEASLAHLAARVDYTQQFLGHRMLLENPSSYVRFEADTMHEADFIAELVKRTGCGLLLDINNLHVSARNHGWDATDWLTRIPLDAVGEIHLAGHEATQDADGTPLLIDSHGDEIADPVWSLYSDFLMLAGPRATLIERDNNVPPLGQLLQEVNLAQLLLRASVPEGAAA
jgi:uncharacterized protein (UPF0276 family)